METLETLKNNYAQEQGYESWSEIMFLNNRNPIAIENHMNEICIRAQKAVLEKASEYFDMHWNKTSITNPENLIL